MKTRRIRIVVFGAFFQPTHMACTECGESVELAFADEHTCEEARRLDFRLFQLRHETAAFELDLHAWLDSAQGRFAVWLAERDRRPFYDRFMEPYWVEPGRLLAGGYPRSLDAAAEGGVTLIVDLTEEGELPPYEARGIRTARMPIADFSCPAPAAMAEILDAIDAELEAGGVVFVHCRGGIGRTGTVVGCWLVRHGVAAEEAVTRLPAPPETPEQRALVRSWR